MAKEKKSSRKEEGIDEFIEKQEESGEDEPQEQPTVSDEPAVHEKKHFSPVSAGVTVFLSLVVILLLVVLVATRSPISEPFSAYQGMYSDGSFLVVKAQGEPAVQLKSQVQQSCPGFLLDEFYIAEVTSPAKQKTLAYIINPATGATECLIDKSTNEAGIAQGLIATVNGEPVYSNQVLALYNAVPEALRTNSTLQEAFEQVVNSKLLYQDAKKQNITASPEEVDAAVTNFMSANGLNLQNFEALLKQSNTTLGDFRVQMAENVIIQKNIAKITESVTTTDAEVRKYYEDSKANMTSMLSASSRQLTVYATQNNSEEKLLYIKGVSTQLNATNFCELVARYSEDATTKENCGLMEAQAGSLLPEYEEAVYSSKPGERKLIATRLGYHIIEVVKINQARNLTFVEAKDSIANYLLLQKKEQVLTTYLASLRQTADIQNMAN